MSEFAFRKLGDEVSAKDLQRNRYPLLHFMDGALVINAVARTREEAEMLVRILSANAPLLPSASPLQGGGNAD